MTATEEDYMLSISKQTLAKLPAAHYQGPISVIDKPEDIDGAVKELYAAPIIGFDTETRPSFKKGQSNTVSLIQLCTPEHCFLFRTGITGITQPLRALLEDPAKTKVGLSLHDDFHNLAKISDLQPDGFIDLQQYVKSVRIADNSLSRIYAIIFGKRISKGQRLSNWEAAHLTEFQQSYAALDAKACIDIYEAISQNRFRYEDSQYKVPIDQLPDYQPSLQQ